MNNMTVPLSQYDARWRNRWFPNAKPYPNTPKGTWNNWGCWGTCICMLSGKDPNQLMDENPDCWTPDYNLLTNKLLKRLGFKGDDKAGYYKEVAGKVLPELGFPIVAVTNYYMQRDTNGKLLSGYGYSYPTHFFIYLGNGQIIDPACSPGNNGPKPIGKYAPFITKYRVLERLH